MSPRRPRYRSRNTLGPVILILVIIVVAVYLRSPSSINILLPRINLATPNVILQTPAILLKTPNVTLGTQAIPPTGGIGKRTKDSGCQVSGSLPDPACTPGAVFDVTTDQICTPGYARSVRNVPQSVKDDVYAEYGIASHAPGEYEVDHLISLELGGSNDIANLWPEAADPRPGYHEKDKVENYLHDQVCSGAMTLKDAQYKEATDWVSIYESMPK